VLGTADLLEYISKYELKIDAYFDEKLVDYPRVPWTKFITPKNNRLSNKDAIDLLDKMLKYDPADRITASEAMAHPYFNQVKTFNSKCIIPSCELFAPVQ
jgi:casein kinase II subunit alpha